jgi:hypothetical protein
MQAFSNTKVNETWLQQLHFESMARLRLVTAALMASFIWTRLRVLLALRDASEEAPNESLGERKCYLLTRRIKFVVPACHTPKSGVIHGNSFIALGRSKGRLPICYSV